MKSTGTLPANLAHLAPGPRLGALLAELDPAGLEGADRLTVVEAWQRQEAHARAGLYRWMAAVGSAPGAAPEWAEEIRAALCWTRRAADRRTDEACALVTELPAVWAALEAGLVDAPRAVVFVDHLAGLPAAQVERICGMVVPWAEQRTTSEIARRLRRLVMEIDPEHFERRFRKAHAERSVWAWVGQDGTATISAGGLAPESADAAVARIDRLARRVRAAGHPGTVGRIRADVFVGLLDGTLHGLDEDAIAQVLLTAAAEPAQSDPARSESARSESARSESARSEPAGSERSEPSPSAPAAYAASAQAHSEPAHSEPAHSEPARSEPARSHPAPSDPRPSEPAPPGPTQSGPTRSEPTPSDPAPSAPARPAPPRSTGTGSEPGGQGRADPGPSSSGATRSLHPADRGARPRQGVHLQVALSTLLGFDDRPAELPDLGPVPASRVRELVAAQRGAPWRFAITGPDGRVVRTGALRRRPDLPAVPCTAPAAPGLVDILVYATLLAELIDDPSRTARPHAHAWSEVLAEIDTPRERPLDDAPRARFPHTGLRRHIELRDRYCTFPGCLAPAHTADLDHTVDHARGGTTTAGGLGPACRHDHGLKQRGWHLDQPEPGRFQWHSPLGRSYRTRSEPLLPPLPTPVRHGPDPELDGEPRSSEAPLLVWRPDPPPPVPCPPPPVELDEPPPF